MFLEGNIQKLRPGYTSHLSKKICRLLQIFAEISKFVIRHQYGKLVGYTSFVCLSNSICQTEFPFATRVTRILRKTKSPHLTNKIHMFARAG